MKILVTGGAGYIGSHTVVELLQGGHDVAVVDDFSNSNPVVFDRIRKITDIAVDCHEIDLCDHKKTNELFATQRYDAVIHFAGLKAVGESVADPLRYYETNLNSTLSLLEAMIAHDVHKLVFSSSATVYGDTGTVKYVETQPAGQNVTNPYGQTKYMIERIITDLCTARPDFEASLLRYFNPIGAHASGLIGEDPRGVPNNLMPFIAQVAAGRRKRLSIFGNDYPTDDGTCRRDYIHVTDLAQGHAAALEHLAPGATAYNLGSGVPVSVLELIAAFEAASGLDVAYEFAPRRYGDLAEFYADPTKAKGELGWSTTLTIADACRDTWHWQSQNPDGYGSE